MSENEYRSMQSRYGSIVPSSIYVGPRAIRNADGSVILRATSTHRSNSPTNLNKHLPINTGITLNDIPKGKLKQPHNKLPLKMILSEVARRGDESFTATVPNVDHHPRTVASVDDILFARPSRVDSKKSRLELLSQPKYMVKKRFQKNVLPGRGIQGREHSFYKINMNNNSDPSSNFTYEENPLAPADFSSSRFCSDLTGNAFPSPTTSNLKYNSSMASSISSTSQPVIGESSSYSQNLSTPFAMSRFLNLYGNSINQQKSNVYQSTSDNPEPSKTNSITTKEPICRLQNRCSYNTIDNNYKSSSNNVFPTAQFVDYVQRINKVADPLHQHQEIEFSYNKEQNTSEATSDALSFLSGENVSKKCIGNKRMYENSSNKFIWEPQNHIPIPEYSKKVKIPLPVYVQNNYSPEGQKENLHYCSADYTYELVEYDVTISSQNDTAYEHQASKFKTSDLDSESILSNGSF